MSENSVKFTTVGLDDPDGQLSLRITNFLGGIDVCKAAAVYAMAMQMSFRDLEDAQQCFILRAIAESCLRGWAQNRSFPEPEPCANCFGLGTIGSTLETFRTCPVCKGTGAKHE